MVGEVGVGEEVRVDRELGVGREVRVGGMLGVGLVG